MQVYFENPFCSLFALAIAVAEILLAALNARHRSHNCTLSDAIHEQVMHRGSRPTAFLSARWSAFPGLVLPAKSES